MEPLFSHEDPQTELERIRVFLSDYSAKSGAPLMHGDRPATRDELFAVKQAIARFQVLLVNIASTLSGG